MVEAQSETEKRIKDIYGDFHDNDGTLNPK